jgi:hypothetical protein
VFLPVPPLLLSSPSTKQGQFYSAFQRTLAGHAVLPAFT